VKKEVTSWKKELKRNSLRNSSVKKGTHWWQSIDHTNLIAPGLFYLRGGLNEFVWLVWLVAHWLWLLHKNCPRTGTMKLCNCAIPCLPHITPTRPPTTDQSNNIAADHFHPKRSVRCHLACRCCCCRWWLSLPSRIKTAIANASYRQHLHSSSHHSYRCSQLSTDSAVKITTGGASHGSEQARAELR
jgi:hypothetical protein